MPRRTDLKRVLVIGSGPIVIGQACEFDYSGTQACKALRDEGLEVILVNSNPATIMTDPDMADRTYVEPLTPEVLAAIIERERPDALLPTLGGQTALNLALELHDQGVLSKHGVRLIGAQVDAIRKADDNAARQQCSETLTQQPHIRMHTATDDSSDIKPSPRLAPQPQPPPNWFICVPRTSFNGWHTLDHRLGCITHAFSFIRHRV